MGRPSYDGAIEWLVRRVPELEPVYREHLDADGEVLPYVVFETGFMGWLRHEAARDSSSAAIDRFLDAVEICLAGRDELTNLMGIGFVEHLAAGGDEAQELLRQLRPRLGPVALAELAAYRRSLGELAQVKAGFSRCRCDTLSEVLDTATWFYAEHLTWIDEYGRGLNLLRCPTTGAFWLSTDARGGHRPRMSRHEAAEDAEKAATALL